MAQRKPFTFSQPLAKQPPPPPQQPKPQPPPASARAQLLLANSAKIRAKHPEPPKKKPRTYQKRPPKKREPAHPSLLDMKAHGLTRENAARIVQRHATAAPVVAEPTEWRPAPVAKELPNLPKAQGFYGSKDEKQAASETARGLHGVQLTERLTAVLRPHQLEGVQWLCARLWQRQGCLLADEMGLGKTATCLASLAVLMGIEGSSARPTTKSFRSVVCCPAGVQRTWASEASKWLRPTPEAAARAQAGGPRHLAVFSSVDVNEARAFARQKRLQERVDARSRKKWTGQESYKDSIDDDAIGRFAKCALEEKPLLVISYESYRAHAERIQAIRDVGLLVLDEAHRLKGGDCVQVNECVARDRAPRRLLVTATPVQNSVDDLRSLLELANAVPEKAPESILREALRTKTLRRSVHESPLNLPPLRECVVYCRPSATQRRVHAEQSGNALARVNRSRHLLSSVHALDETQDDLASVGKWAFATSLLEACRARNERVVIVSQFSGPLRAAERLASVKNWPCRTIDGATSLEARHDAQSKLNGTEDFFLLCLALRAGGVGLTLTGASRIILFEPSWNPSDDAQAVARVWRWGQRRETRVYRLATADSIEERVLTRQAAKVKLCERVAHLQRAEALLDTCKLEQAFDADAKRNEDAQQLCALGSNGVHVACAAARAADAAFVACDPVLEEASSSLVDGEPAVRGVRCRARISY